MKFFDFLISDLNSYSIYQNAQNASTKNDEFGNLMQNFLKKPDKKVAIIQPQNFSDVLRFVEFISGNRSAVVDFNALDGSEIQRSVDFVGGAVCALHGEMQNIANGIYLFAPSCTKLMTNKRKKRKQ